MTRDHDISNEEDRAKLPAWARPQVEALLRDNQHLRAELAAGPEDSDTFSSPRRVMTDRPLGRGPTINFGVVKGQYANGQDYTQHVLDARWDAAEETLHVSSYNGTVQIIPWATNCFKVRLLGG